MKKITSIYRLLDEVKAAAGSPEENKHMSVIVELGYSEPHCIFKAWVPSIKNYVTAGSASELVELARGAVSGVKNDLITEDDRAPDYKEQELFPEETPLGEQQDSLGEIEE